MRLADNPTAQSGSGSALRRFQNQNALEVIVADHCNLTCRQCNHASPAIRKKNLPAAEIDADLALLSKVYKPAAVKYIGGEPLLNPEIADIVANGRKAYPRSKHWLVTNGSLIDRARDALWAVLDIMDLSIYPGQELSDETMRALEEKARRFSTRLVVNSFPVFRYTYTSMENKDEALVRDVFHACKMAQVWTCHSLYSGRIYRCPQSIYGAQISGRDIEDGLQLRADKEFAADLSAFLTADEPLRTCRNCVGSCGAKFEHTMLSRKAWLPDIAMPVEAILDRELMEVLLKERREVDDCKRLVAQQLPPRPSALARLVRKARVALDQISRD